MKSNIYTVALTLFISFSSFAQPGSLDISFGGDGKVSTAFGQYGSAANAVAIQANKKIVVAGSQFNATNDGFEIIRYNADGDLDKTFGTKGNATIVIGNTSHAYAVAVQDDGKIVVAGTSSNGSYSTMAVARFKENGLLDSSFNNSGIAIISFTNIDASGNSLLILPNGKIVVGGSIGSGIGSKTLKFAMARLNSNGTTDNNFGNHGKVTTGFSNRDAFINKLALQADGKIVAAGMVSETFTDDFAVIRYKDNGTIDAGFGNNGRVTADFEDHDRADGVVVQIDGKIVVGGTTSGTANGLAMIRLRRNGTPDSSFGSNGKVVTTYGSTLHSTLGIQSDGKILLAGAIVPNSGPSNDYGNFLLARFNTNGQPDNNFGVNGQVNTDFNHRTNEAHDILVQPNGKIVVAGESSPYPTFAVARYNAGPSGLTSDVANDISISRTKEPSLALYPNPAQDKLLITGLGNETGKKLSVINAAGNTLKTVITNENAFSMDLQRFPGGVYYLRIQYSNKTILQKFIKQ